MPPHFSVFLILALVCASLSQLESANPPVEKPNIVLILSDDLGYADIGAYGNELNQTPNLDRMAEEGLRFTDFHSNAANCSPTRAAILTGQYPQRWGIDGALGEGAEGLSKRAVTIAERLREVGYATALMGKWHLGYEPVNGPTRQGFDEFVGHLHGATDYLSRVDRYGRRDWWQNEEPLEEQGHNTTLITKHAVRFIKEHEGEPFFLFVSHSAIHFPWQTTADKAHRVPGKRYEGSVGKLGPHARGPLQPVVQGMIEELDASVGEIMAALKNQELEKRTLVFFTSDNGGIVTLKGLPPTPKNRISDNSPWRGQKHGLYEGGHRVPAIAWWPGMIQGGDVSDSLSLTMDLSPTFLELAGQGASKSESDGLSLKPHLLHNEPLPERTVFWKGSRQEQEAIRWKQWKLVRHQGRVELFNLEENPAELPGKNLVGDRPDIANQLLDRLRKWEASVSASEQETETSDPASPIMLAGDWVPHDPHQIDYAKLPRVAAEHAIISDVRDQAGTRVHQHAYLAHHDGRFWAMWSDGPGLPRRGATPEEHRNKVPGHDQPGTRNSYATSEDGLHWSEPADLTGPPRIENFGWIARGLWKRDGELLALASHFNAPTYDGPGLSLEAFRWNGTKWDAHGTVLDDSMNNFPPKRLPSGEWMMTRRDHQRQVSVMIGGTKAFNDWQIHPLAAYDGNGRPEEPYWYILPDGETIVGLIRDNGRSKFLLRTFSRDDGKTWSKMQRTNFPDATSKFFVHRSSRGYYVMVSNANPRKRDPLTLAISEDGLVFTKLFWLIGGRHIDYPHIIEHDGHLLVAFSGAKQTMEVMKVSLDELERLEMPESVELANRKGSSAATLSRFVLRNDEEFFRGSEK
ncbi:MAG: sulfatase-like hydrolase/transferase [Verrucomicrobiota bacterium]